MKKKSVWTNWITCYFSRISKSYKVVGRENTSLDEIHLIENMRVLVTMRVNFARAGYLNKISQLFGRGASQVSLNEIQLIENLKLLSTNIIYLKKCRLSLTHKEGVQFFYWKIF